MFKVNSILVMVTAIKLGLGLTVYVLSLRLTLGLGQMSGGIMSGDMPSPSSDICRLRLCLLPEKYHPDIYIRTYTRVYG